MMLYSCTHMATVGVKGLYILLIYTHLSVSSFTSGPWCFFCNTLCAQTMWNEARPTQRTTHEAQRTTPHGPTNQLRPHRFHLTAVFTAGFALNSPHCQGEDVSNMMFLNFPLFPLFLWFSRFHPSPIAFPFFPFPLPTHALYTTPFHRVTRWSRSTYTSYTDTTSGPVSTWMGDRLRVGKPSQYVSSHLL